MARFLTGFSRTMRWLVMLLSTAVLAYLSFSLSQRQAYMPLTRLEDMVFVQQDASIWLVTGLLTLGLLVVRPLLKALSDAKLFMIGAVLYLAVGAYLIAQTTDMIRGDARQVFEVAVAMNQGNFSSLTVPGGYPYLHPHQLGLVTLERFYLLFSDSPRFIFGINLILVLATIFIQNRLTKRLYPDGLASRYQLLVSFSFLPQLFFILFAYGAIPGGFFITLGAYCFLRYHQEGQAGFAWGGVLSVALAVTIRNNYQIFLLALLGLWFLGFLKKQDKSYLFLIVSSLVTVFLMGKVLTISYETAIGQPLSPGVPKLAYVTMGLQEDPKGAVGGWWNTYNTKILTKNGYDQDQAQAQVRADLQAELDRLKADPSAALLFFKDKAHSTWLDPTFQSVWTGPLKERQQEVSGRLLTSIYHEGRGYAWLNRYGAAWLLLVYALAGLFWLLGNGRAGTELSWSHHYLPFVFLLGGVLFHLVWETKSQYVLIYIFGLIPAASASLERLTRMISN